MEDKEKQINRTDNFGELSDTVSIPNKEKTISVSKFENIELTIPCKKSEQEKQIEEIALCLQSYSNISQSYYGGEWRSADVYYGLAKSLYYNDFRIVPKDSVLLSKKEYNKTLEQFRQEIVTLSQELVNSRKEMVEKFIEECKKYKVKKFSPVGIDQRDTGVSWIEMPEWKFDEFVKQFGAEVEV